eukprot:TRINITY_DN17071_c0_g1_i1.p1 TRINITY_DN17071_c0_g1~~TRINITY_DN17071_c0_g1_i1.p1  ORF type:complete len:323 (+),score=97.66 TRINITY_DN17071_c0_g1_i1:86-970(+)
MAPRHLLPPSLQSTAAEWINHDIPGFDVGGAVVGSTPACAVFYAKSNLVVAGQPFVEAIYANLGCAVEWAPECPEGTLVKASGKQRMRLGKVTGPACRILQGERTALEVMTRCSATALATRQAVDIAARAGWKGSIAATRKTTPGAFRLVEKYGVLVGGGDTHRYSLSTMTMLKDNHVDAAGGITAAVKEAKRLGGFALKVEVEARTEHEAEEACSAGADVVMLDNFTPAQQQQLAPRLKQKYPNVLLEASGGITHSSLAKHLVDGMDILSMGCLTHGTPATDISLKIDKGAKL